MYIHVYSIAIAPPATKKMCSPRSHWEVPSSIAKSIAKSMGCPFGNDDGEDPDLSGPTGPRRPRFNRLLLIFRRHN